MAPEMPLTNPWNIAPRGSSDGVSENQMNTSPTVVPVNV
ncbi:hypothetical protein PICSAR26_04284 [Mycobacterium avium subsp. paratuberculosis]|nr:hypothetical protein PICSAR26_04284 [Mycobacterium avium subsp. paratuberculosis]